MILVDWPIQMTRLVAPLKALFSERLLGFQDLLYRHALKQLLRHVFVLGLVLCTNGSRSQRGLEAEEWCSLNGAHWSSWQ